MVNFLRHQTHTQLAQRSSIDFVLEERQERFLIELYFFAAKVFTFTQPRRLCKQRRGRSPRDLNSSISRGVGSGKLFEGEALTMEVGFGCNDIPHSTPLATACTGRKRCLVRFWHLCVVMCSSIRCVLWVLCSGKVGTPCMAGERVKVR